MDCKVQTSNAGAHWALGYCQSNDGVHQMFESVAKELYAKGTAANGLSEQSERMSQSLRQELHNKNLQDLFLADYRAAAWRPALNDEVAGRNKKAPPDLKPAEEGIRAGDGVTIDASSGTVVIAEKGSIVTARKGSLVYAKEGSRVTAEAGALVEVTGAADVYTQPGSDIKLMDGAIVEAASGPCVHVAEYNVKMEAYGSKINVYKGSDVEAKKGSEVIAHKGVTVYAYTGSKVTAKTGSSVVAAPKTSIDAENGTSIVTRDSDAKLVIVGGWDAYQKIDVCIKTNYPPEVGQVNLFVKSRRDSHLEYMDDGRMLESIGTKPLEAIADRDLRDRFPYDSKVWEGTFDSTSKTLKSFVDRKYNQNRSYEIVRLTPSCIMVQRENNVPDGGYFRTKK